MRFDPVLFVVEEFVEDFKITQEKEYMENEDMSEPIREYFKVFWHVKIKTVHNKQ